MKSNGYTIAETVITLAIIGVVAALTIPAFVANYRKQTYASSLSNAVTNFENAMTTMMMQEGVNDLFDTKAWKSIESSGNYKLTMQSSSETIENFMNSLNTKLSIEGYETTKLSYKNFSNSNSSTSVSYGRPIRFQTKGGVEYAIYIDNVSKSKAKKEIEMLAKNCNYLNKAATVNIDLNGAKKPNLQGRDFFLFELGTDGILYPKYSRDWAVFHDYSYTSPQTECVVNKNGDYCGAYLRLNGYKMDY